MNDALKFLLEVEPDTKAAQDAIDALAGKLDKDALTAAKQLGAELKAGTATLADVKKLTDQINKARADAASLRDTEEKGFFAKAWEHMTGKDGTGGVGTMLGAILGGKGGQSGMLGSALGGAGFAIAGPIGAELGSALAEVLPKAVAAPAKLAAASLNLVADSLRALGGQLGPIGLGFDYVTGVLSKASDTVKAIPIIGDLLGGFTDALATLPSIFKDIISTLTSFAGVASPGQMRLFQMAIEDVQGVIGQAFIPMLELMRDAVRFVGDALANFLPSATEVRTALTEFRQAFDEVLEAGRQGMAEWGPEIRRSILEFIRELAHLGASMVPVVTAIADLYMALREVAQLWQDIKGPMEDFTDVFSIFTNVLRGAALYLKDFVAVMRSILGLPHVNAPPGDFRSSVGAAARPARMSSIDAYQQQLQIAALSQGAGTTSMNQVPGLVQQIGTSLEQINQKLHDGISVTVLNWLLGGDNAAEGGNEDAQSTSNAAQWAAGMLSHIPAVAAGRRAAQLAGGHP